jgi:hypothetical protein
VIGGRRITAPDGTAWRIGRRWLPERKRLRRRRDNDEENSDRGRSGSSDSWWRNIDFGTADADDVVVVILGIVAVIAAILLFATVLVPILVVGLEILLVIVLFLGGLAGRLLFRRPWTIRARAADGRELTWRAVGFRRSGRVRDEIAGALALGQTDVQPVEAQGSHGSNRPVTARRASG